MSCSHLLNNFNPRPPRGGRLITAAPPMQPITISIHAPREGGDGKRKPCYCGKVLFQSTPPARGATYLPVLDGFHAPLFQSTPPARGATDGATQAAQFIGISIHAPREGGDDRTCPSPARPRRFQSTPPARGATAGAVVHDRLPGISIHAPREGGDQQSIVHPAGYRISIHAPREGGDYAVLE